MQSFINSISPNFWDLSSVKYYSFRIGPPFSNLGTWRLVDIKIPSFSPKMAISMHYFHSSWLDEDRHKYLPQTRRIIHVEPDGSLVHYIYRQVLEYERLERPKLGYVKHQYKLLKVYSQHQIASWFDD